MEVIAILIVGLYLVYKTGILDLTTKSVERASNIADRSLEVFDEKSLEKRSRDLGKLADEYADEDVSRADAKALNTARKAAIARMSA